jgi:DME family drug/metabolite transporter
MAPATPRALRTAFAALPEHRQGLLAVTGAAVLWSTGGLFIKWVSLDALGITMWRSVLAGATIAVLARSRPVLPWRAGWLRWGVAVSYALMLLLFVSATKLTTAANAIFLQYTAPLYVLAIGPLVLDERPTRTDLITVFAAFGGMALFFVGRLEARDAAGNLCAIGSGVAFAAFLTLLRLPSCTPATRPEAMVLGNALLVVSLLAVNLIRFDPGPFTPGPGDIAALVFLGVIQIGLAYVFFGFGIAHVQALEASLIGMLEPVLNPIWVLVALGEVPGWWAVAGGTVIVLAVTGRTIASERRRSILARADFGVLGSEA